MAGGRARRHGGGEKDNGRSVPHMLTIRRVSVAPWRDEPERSTPLSCCPNSPASNGCVSSGARVGAGSSIDGAWLVAPGLTCGGREDRAKLLDHSWKPTDRHP